MMVCMQFELRVVPNCPHRRPAAALFRDVLDAAGLAGAGFDTVVIDTAATAAALNFTGSPTFVIDGADVFPQFPAQPAVGCRLYQTEQGPRDLPLRDDLLAAVRAKTAEARLAAAQHTHWQQTYAAHPGLYGDEPSDAAKYALELFSSSGATTVLELGGGHGRDALFFARNGLTTQVVDFSTTALRQLTATAAAQGLCDRIVVIEHDVRAPLPVGAASVDAVFAHMLLCMALSTNTIRAIVSDVRRVLRPGGIFIYTARHTGDAHYRAGISRGDDIYEHGGFAVHYFSRQLVDELAAGWKLIDVREFSEGALPRRLFCVTQTRPAQ
jgi:SAM-dependent methyltransferase